ncbi:MAG: hypothetical protein R2911_00995 [Caldilineaceae bacterium]
MASRWAASTCSAARNPWPVELAAGGGAIGISLSYNFNGGKFDNFGGGNIVLRVNGNRGCG